MRLIIFLTSVIVLAGCAKDAPNSDTPSAQAAPTLTITTTGSTAGSSEPDYSSIACGQVGDCSNACDFKYPFAGATAIQAICPGSSQTCLAVEQINQTDYVASNTLCQNLMTTAVISTSSIGSASCESVSECESYCATTYVPVADSLIVNEYGTSGEVYTFLLANEALKSKLAACLAAPANFIL